MKLFANFLLLSCLAARGVFANESGQPIQDLPLDRHVVYAVPISGSRITTISFPGVISAIDAAFVTTDAKTAGLFQLAHTPNTSYFSARALVKGATTNLNVRWHDQTYVVELRESATPWLAVNFQSPADSRSAAPKPLTSARLLGLLDKAKAFPLLKESHPEALAGVEFRDGTQQPSLTDCGDYTVRVDQAFRFDQDDTLIFHLTLQNKTQRLIEFVPERLQLKAGSFTLYPSVAQIGDLIPAQSASDGWVAFSGTAEGGRNDLSLKNDFTFVLDRGPAEPSENPSKTEEGFAK